MVVVVIKKILVVYFDSRYISGRARPISQPFLEVPIINISILLKNPVLVRNKLVSLKVAD